MIIIGLGNPGKKYENNRHNVGKMFVDYISQKSKVKSQKFNLKLKTFKTDCFMNESGKFIKKLTNNQPPSINHLIIVHDDLDIPLGKFRIDFGKGPRLHKGLKSIEQTLKTKDFWRIRIGVDNRRKTGWVEGEAYVLQNFLPEEREILEKEVFGKIVERLFKMVK